MFIILTALLRAHRFYKDYIRLDDLMNKDIFFDKSLQDRINTIAKKM